MPAVKAGQPRPQAELFARLLAMGPSDERRSVFDRRAAPPDPARLSRWLGLAEAKYQAALAQFDQLLLEGVAAPEAALDVSRRYTRWTRESLVPFVGTIGARHATLQKIEQEAWSEQAVRMAEHVERDPAQLDAFLRHWLATVHEAVATGFASMFAW